MPLEKFTGEKLPMAHNFFFQLADETRELRERFVALCVRYLSGHEGQIYFSVGSRVLDINRDVSGTNFDISVNMVFANFDAYTKYSDSPKHEEFIAAAAGMSPTRVVYDSFLSIGTPLP